MKKNFLIVLSLNLLCATVLAEPIGKDASALGGAHHGSHEKLTCEQILNNSFGENAESNEKESSQVSEVIFHHVTDSYYLTFENPLSHAQAKIDFKKLECSWFGWNGVVKIGDYDIDLTPTKHTFWMFVASIALILLFIIGKPKKGQLVPHGFGNVLEAMVLFVRNEIARKIIGEKEADKYVPYLLCSFFFILIMNLIGLVPYAASATSNIAVTAALSFLTFVVTQIAGIRSAGFGGYIKHLTGGLHPILWPVMVPVEFLGLFTKPFALTIRLFANMVAGHIVIFFLLGLIFIFKSLALAPLSVAFALAISLLEIFVALVQAYVFTMLSALFIGMGVSMGHSHGSSNSSDDHRHH